ncbi:MAG: peptidoglycan editing factor PgeF [Pseudomonadota bacterium]
MTDRTAARLERLTCDGLSAAHGFFTRQGGVSTGAYASLNCGFGAKEDTAERVAENRARVAAALGSPRGATVSTAYQIHSAKVARVTADIPREGAPQADALVTDRPGLAIGVLTADCAPVLLEDAEAGVVGAAHAGWRGALAGVVEATVDAMADLGAQPGRMTARIGPCIGPQAYEVGPEFFEAFREQDQGAADIADFFTAAAKDSGKRRFDLPAYVLDRLRRAAVADRAWIGLCTYADEARFFSNRRATHRREADYGRLLSAIVNR